MSTADQEYLVSMAVAESLDAVFLIPSVSPRHTVDELSEHCSALLASDSILDDKQREEIRILQTAMRQGNSASGQDVDKTNAALAQLES